MVRAGAFVRSISLVRTRKSCFGRCTGHAQVFLLCFPRGLARKKNRRVLGASWAQKGMNFRRKQSKTKLVLAAPRLFRQCGVPITTCPRVIARGGQKPPPRERDARNQRDEPPPVTKRRMSTHLFLAITLIAVSGADKHLWRTRPPGPLSGARATDAPPQGHAGDTRC